MPPLSLLADDRDDYVDYNRKSRAAPTRPSFDLKIVLIACLTLAVVVLLARDWKPPKRLEPLPPNVGEPHASVPVIAGANANFRSADDVDAAAAAANAAAAAAAAAEHARVHHHAGAADPNHRNFSIVNVCWSPRVFLIRDLLTPAQVARLLEKGTPHLSPSEVAEGNKSKRSSYRTSSGAWVNSNDDPILRELEERIAEVTHSPVANQEQFYLLQYEIGQQYKKHWDYFDPSYYDAKVWLGTAGQRVKTVVMYLSHPEEGGETRFPDANCDGKGTTSEGLSVLPGVGDAVLFYDVHDDGTLDPASMHEGMPVIKGTKMIATKWIRANPFQK